MDNKHISNTAEASSEGLLNNGCQPNVFHVTLNFNFTEKNFDALVNNMIKSETYFLYHDKSSDSEYSACIASKSFDYKNKKQQQNEMCELASTSYEKDVNVSESNSLELIDTKLVNGKIVSMHTSSPSTALPIMKILLPKSGPHTCIKWCFKCNHVFHLHDSPVHIHQIQSIDKQNEFLKTVEPPNVKVNPVSIKRKQSNVICDTASNKDVKKQKLNEKLSSYEKNSTHDNTTKSDKYKNIAYSSINPQGTLKMTYNSKNKYDSNSGVSDSEMFSDTDSEKILPDCEKNETDCIIVASDDDLGLDSNCQLIKCKFEIKPDCAIEMDKNDTKSITSTALLNVAKQNLCTPKLELKDEGLDIVNLEEEYYKKYDNSLQNVCQVENESGFISSGQVVSEHNEIENNQRKLNSDVVCSVSQDTSSIDLKEGYQCINKINTIHKSEEILLDSEKYKTEYMIVASDYDLGLNSNCELLKSKFETKPDHEIEMDCKFAPNNKKSLDEIIILNGENYTTYLDSEKDSNCEMVLDAETESDSDKHTYITIYYDNEEEFKYFKNTESQSFKQLNSQIDNDKYMQGVYNREHVVPEIADELSKDYSKEQKTTLYNCFRDHTYSIVSKPFKHSSSHIYQYSKPSSSDNIEPLIVKNIKTTSSSPIQSNSIASPRKNITANKGVGSKVILYLQDDNQKFTCFNSEHKTYHNIQFPVTVKNKTVTPCPS